MSKIDKVTEVASQSTHIVLNDEWYRCHQWVDNTLEFYLEDSDEFFALTLDELMIAVEEGDIHFYTLVELKIEFV